MCSFYRIYFSVILYFNFFKYLLFVVLEFICGFYFYLLIHLFFYLFLFSFIFLFIWLFINLYIYLFINLYIYLFTYLFISSIYLLLCSTLFFHNLFVNFIYLIIVTNTSHCYAFLFHSILSDYILHIYDEIQFSIFWNSSNFPLGF